MILKPKRRDEKQSSIDFLHRKWGFTDVRANEAVEKTHQLVLEMVKGQENRMNEAQKKHFEAKRRFEDKWQNGEFIT